MAFGKTVGHVEIDAFRSCQFAQGSDEQRSAGLAVHIKVAPDENVSLLRDGVVENVRGPIQPDQRGGRRGSVGAGVEKRQSRGRGVDAPLGQQLGDERMSSHRGGQRGRRGNGRGDEPGAG